MALRTFSCNPALGGFGGESFSSQHSQALRMQKDPCGDAFAQIVKELVDNAIDACLAQKHTLESDSQTVGRRVRVVIENAEKSGEEDTELLRVTVSDNGVGMDDVQRCVNPFCSSKQQSDAHSHQRQESDETEPDKTELQTFGRYGIGLTLCLLHGQRLVPNSSSQITSTTATSSHWNNTLWVVDTEDDTVKCVKQEYIAKTASKNESGTQVSLLLPGGVTAERAWLRLEEYFNRFHLNVGLACTIEVLAPSLCRVPLRIQPTLLKDTGNDIEGNSTSKAGMECAARCLAIREAAQKYLGRQIEMENIAHDRVPIQMTDDPRRPDEPYLEVSIVVLPDVAESSDDDDEAAELGTDTSREGDAARAEEVIGQHGTLKLVRMVNKVPLLDTTEALGCGVVYRLCSLRHVWHSFGLEVDSMQSESDGASVPTFKVRDSEQVLPFLAKGAHELFQPEADSDDESNRTSDDSSGSDNDDELRRRRRRSRTKTPRIIAPARVRFASSLMVVHIHGTPSTLPLPTLSKGRLPTDNQAINTALELGLSHCLRMLQRANPYLLLSTGLLQSSERDARYVPHLASSVVSIIQCFESRSNQPTKHTIISWTQNDKDNATSDDSSQSSSCDMEEEEADFVELLESQIRRRLETVKITDNQNDQQSQSSGSSNSSGDGEPASKKAFQSFFSSNDDDNHSSSDGSESEGANQDASGGADDEFTDLDDWL